MNENISNITRNNLFVKCGLVLHNINYAIRWKKMHELWSVEFRETGLANYIFDKEK